MKITLDANPDDAPCCLKLVAEDGREVLVQADYDWPGVALSFGWSIREVEPRKPEYYSENWRTDLNLQLEEAPRFEAYEKQLICDHTGTDGTVACKTCGMSAEVFMSTAREWLDEHDGAEVEDPGYFEE